ncbi:hypothetical protein J4E05_08790 [Thalassospira sp. NFXS8]|uniref:hypothetical protein n=1 Tax=Thalassospira sp. NFXS8 TaxID=2819093 RepID=UPI0032DF42F5
MFQFTNEAFSILSFLFPGYLGFRIYFIDKSWNNLSPINVFYGSLVFSFFSYLIVFGMVYAFFDLNFVLQSYVFALISTPIAIVLGLLWRLFGHTRFHKFLYKIKVTNEDNNSSPWMQLFNNPQVSLSQITVHMKNGVSLKCDDTSYFSKEEWMKIGLYSHYTCAEGDVYFIANRIRTEESGEWVKVEDLHVEDPWGVKIQWIPVSEISRVEVRAVKAT